MFSSTAYNHSYADSGLFCIHSSAPPGDANKIVSTITTEYMNLISESFHNVEVSRAKKQTQSMLMMNLESRVVKFEDIGREKTITRKIKEILLAIKIEQVYTKDEILEMYLNSVYFGNIKSRPMWGIQKASKMIFGKDVSELELHESSLLIAIL